MAFTAGQKVRASDMNRGVPTLVRVAADTSVVSSTTLVDGVGAVAAVEADAFYWWRLHLHFTGNATGDIKVAWTVPTGATGFWGLVGATVGVAAYGDANPLTTIDGANTLAVLDGFLDTSSTAGNLQLRFAQNTSNGTATVVKAGSLLSVARVA